MFLIVIKLGQLILRISRIQIVLIPIEEITSVDRLALWAEMMVVLETQTVMVFLQIQSGFLIQCVIIVLLVVLIHQYIVPHQEQFLVDTVIMVLIELVKLVVVLSTAVLYSITKYVTRKMDACLVSLVENLVPPPTTVVDFTLLETLVIIILVALTANVHTPLNVI
jgi:predicted nucleic-acid-binding protein